MIRLLLLRRTDIPFWLWLWLCTIGLITQEYVLDLNLLFSTYHPSRKVYPNRPLDSAALLLEEVANHGCHH